MVAQGKASRYVKKNNIGRLKCQNCGDPKTEMHHKDYTKPLHVVFLCKACHCKVHTGELTPPKEINLEEMNPSI